MANVFLSYQKRDAALALRMVQLLNGAGLTVWWDDDLTPRESWDRIIEREIHQADQVLVLWTPNSVQSEWVRIEANYALNCTPSKLVQARFDAAQVPIAFSMRQYVDLDFAEPDRGPSWDRLLSWLGGRRDGDKVASGASTAAAPESAPTEPSADKSSTAARKVAALPFKSVWAPIGLRAALPDMPQPQVFILFVVGMILYNLMVILEVGRDLGAGFFWAVMAVFGLPLSITTLARSGRWARSVFLLALIPTAHFLAVSAAVSGSRFTPFAEFGAGAIGGGVGASLCFATLVLFGGTMRESRWLQISVVATVALIIIGGVGLSLDGIDEKFGSLALYVPWQLLFGYALSLILTGSPPPWDRKAIS